MSTWLLPENIADVLPSEARKIEELRRRLLDRFRSYGYELVMPPITTMPRLARVLDPGSSARASGMLPAMTEMLVMMMGRNRVNALS